MKADRPARRRAVDAVRVGSGDDDKGGFTYHIVVAPPLSDAAHEPADRRAGGRVRTRLRDATVSETRGRVLAECRIHDRSRDGARLQLDKDRPLPRTFVLRDPAAGTSRKATLIWQHGIEAGVRLAT